MKKLNIVYARGYAEKQAKAIIQHAVREATGKHNVIMSALYGNKNNLEHINEPIDIYHCHSGFSIESMKKAKKLGAKVILQRDSAHCEIMRELVEEDKLFWRQNSDYKGMCDPARREDLRFQLAEYELADYILLASTWERDTMIKKGVNPKKLVIIPFTADSAVFKPRNHETRDFSVVLGGNRCIRKGYPYAREACKRAGVELTVIEGLPFEQMTRALNEHTVCLAPTVEDGYPHQVLASMSCGLVPIVSTNTGTKDLIKDADNGFIIDMSESKEEIIEDIAYILNHLKDNPEDMREIGEKARKTIEKRPWSDYSKDICEFYERIIE